MRVQECAHVCATAHMWKRTTLRSWFLASNSLRWGLPCVYCHVVYYRLDDLRAFRSFSYLYLCFLSRGDSTRVRGIHYLI